MAEFRFGIESWPNSATLPGIGRSLLEYFSSHRTASLQEITS